jgi:hypothetical protein
MREVVASRRRRVPTSREKNCDHKAMTIVIVSISVVLVYYVVEWLMLRGYF